MPSTERAQPSETQGILLYYKYVQLLGTDAEVVANFYKELCGRLDLRGRIRVARDGVNVTVGGSMAALQAHAAAVAAHPLLRGGDIDFKLAASEGPRNEVTRTETKMDRLVVRLCEELVTLGPLARHRADPRSSTAPHLTPEQFHGMLERAMGIRPVPASPREVGLSKGARTVPEATAGGDGQLAAGIASEAGAGGPEAAECDCRATAVKGTVDGRVGAARTGASSSRIGVAVSLGIGVEESDGVEGGACDGGGDRGDGNVAAMDASGGGPVVLLDARNIYETRIGHFDAGPSVTTLDPRTRCFSDLPAWLDAHEELLRNRTVLMYCTGGVRCERASAYLREKGPEFSRVFQLSGGIQRYLEHFPGGGLFRGKNFLYDDRIAVGPRDVEKALLGSCLSNPSPLPGVVGRCQLCGCAWDDYGARLRCSRCRLLILVCDSCSALLHHHNPNQRLPGERRRGCNTTEQRTKQISESVETGAHNCPPAITGPLSSQIPLSFASRYSESFGGEQSHRPPAPPQLLCELCSSAMGGPTGCGGQVQGAQLSVDGLATNGGDSVREVGAAAANGGADPVGASSSAATHGVSNLQVCGHSPPSTTTSVDEAAGGPLIVDKSSVELGGVAVTGGGAEPRRLRILCLHGFRQTGKQFQGRTCALRKKLRDIADFVFVDAPHKLPFFLKTPPSKGASGARGTADTKDTDAGVYVDTAAPHDVDANYGAAAGAKHDADIDANTSVEAPVGMDLAAVTISGSIGGANGYGDSTVPESDDGEDGTLLEGINCDGELHTGLDATRKKPCETVVEVIPPLAAKRAWLLPPELYSGSTTTSAACDGSGKDQHLTTCGWQDAPSYVDELQYTRQTEGWQESLATIQAVIRQQGPFDGIFGFSQGAAVAAVLCALQQQQRQQQQLQPEMNMDPEISVNCDFGFQFAILASGFPSPLPQHREMLAAVGPLELPSLHVYGSINNVGFSVEGADRQISFRESEALVTTFSCANGQRRCLCHQSGHLIPATKSHTATFRSFLTQFVHAPQQITMPPQQK